MCSDQPSLYTRTHLTFTASTIPFINYYGKQFSYKNGGWRWSRTTVLRFSVWHTDRVCHPPKLKTHLGFRTPQQHHCLFFGYFLDRRNQGQIPESRSSFVDKAVRMINCVLDVYPLTSQSQGAPFLYRRHMRLLIIIGIFILCLDQFRRNGV